MHAKSRVTGDVRRCFLDAVARYDKDQKPSTPRCVMHVCEMIDSELAAYLQCARYLEVQTTKQSSLPRPESYRTWTAYILANVVGQRVGEQEGCESHIWNAVLMQGRPD